MISKRLKKHYRAVLQSSNVCRRKADGRKNMEQRMFMIFSLGNPATPAPAAFNTAIKELVDETDPLVLHGYMEKCRLYGWVGPHCRESE